MASMKVTGLQQFSKDIAKLASKGTSLCKYALYDGAAVVADAISESIDSLGTEVNHYVNDDVVTQENPPSTQKMHALSDTLKKELKQNFGIATMQEDSKGINTILGFNGYSSITTDKYKSGLPLQMVARSLESGSSYRESYPFVRSAVNRSKAAAKQAMSDAADEYIKGFNF